MRHPFFYILNPIYWPFWIFFGVLWIIIHCPKKFRFKCGVCLGKFLYCLPTQIKHITEVNLKLCFPDWTDKKRSELAKKNFKTIGVACIESAMAWWLPSHQLTQMFQIQGLEYLQEALRKNKGVILLTPHFTCLEIVGRLMSMHHTFGVIYRPHKKPFVNFIHECFRKKHYDIYIPNNRIRDVLKTLKNNTPIWYAYDIDSGIRKNSVFAPFFGVPTATMTTLSRIARLSQAVILPLAFYRKDYFNYEIVVSAALENFPSENLAKDAARLNAILETAIRAHPDQYVWQYKRFKTRPKGQRRFYFSTNPNR